MVEPVIFQSATQLLSGLAAGAFSSKELVEASLGQIEQHNPAINAVVTLDVEGARAAAVRADNARMRGETIGKLHGLPITVKDLFQTSGLRTTSGSPMLSDYVPDLDAVAVQRLRDAGAIVIGKTNVPEFGGDAQSYNDLFGVTNNPWDTKRTPGGSSGGSAAAIAAGFSALELGSDLGGSLRIPAHFCGVYTLKPTYGVIPVTGHIPPHPGSLMHFDIAVAGPLARSADDLELALNILAGPEGPDARAWQLNLPAPGFEGVSDLRIAVCMDDAYCPVDREIAAVYGELLHSLQHAGIRCLECELPVPLAEGHEIAQRLIQSEISAFIPEDHYLELNTRAQTAAADDPSAPVRWARNVTQSARDRQIALETRLKQKEAWATFFEEYDVLVCPVTPTPAFPHDHTPDVDSRAVIVNDGEIPYGDQWAWLQAIGVVHLPVVVAPVGRTQNMLPVGIQIVAPLYGDRTAIAVATLLADIVGGYEPPPGF
jgi:amidase